VEEQWSSSTLSLDSLSHSLTHRSGTQWQHTHSHTHTHTRRYSLLPMINTFNESSSKINESFSTDRDPSELHSPLTASLTHSPPHRTRPPTSHPNSTPSLLTPARLTPPGLPRRDSLTKRCSALRLSFQRSRVRKRRAVSVCCFPKKQKNVKSQLHQRPLTRSRTHSLTHSLTLHPPCYCCHITRGDTLCSSPLHSLTD
jgi:hypothetical protein